MAVISITGGAGFIGSNCVRYWLHAYPENSFIKYDLLTYARKMKVDGCNWNLEIYSV